MIHNHVRLCRINTVLWKNSLFHRNIKTKVEEKTKIKFTDTINLPKSKFPARLNQQQRAELEDVIRTVRT